MERPGLAALFRGNLLSLEDVARLSSLTLGVINSLLRLTSEGDVVWRSRDPATVTRQARAASDESSPSEAQRSCLTCAGRRGRRPRPGPPRQLSARTAGPRSRPTGRPPASATPRPRSTGRRVLQQSRCAATPSRTVIPVDRAARSRRHWAAPPPGSSLRKGRRYGDVARAGDR